MTIMADQNIEPSLTLKDFAILAPLLGSTLAVSFDVGYFFGRGIDLFSLFSLSEHVTFALLALPLALATSVIVLTVVMAGAALMKTRPMRPAVPEWIRVTALFVLSIASLVLGILAWFVSVGLSFLGMLCAVTVVVLGLEAVRRSTILQLAIASIIAMTITTGLGYSFGTDTGSPSLRRLHTLKTTASEFHGRLLRSGDRGVLFLEAETDRIIFIRWDEIKALIQERP